MNQARIHYIHHARGDRNPTMLDDYVTYCRAAGMRPATIRLRCLWLRKAATELDLATADTTMLIGWLSRHEWQPETRRSATNALRSFYGWAAGAGRRPDDPAGHLPPIRVPAGIPHPTPCTVLDHALDQATGRDRLMIGLAAYAGLRRSEIASLPWSAINWPQLRVVGKGGRTRIVPILPELGDMLLAELARRRQGELGTGWRFTVDPYSPYVFPSHTGGHLAPYTVGTILSEALGPGWTGHSLRHRFATKAYAVGRDLLTVQQLLGHSSPQTTARYTAIPLDAAMIAVSGVA